MSDDKMYIIIIVGMIGIFVYWYQTRLDELNRVEKKEKTTDHKVYCSGCKRGMVKRSKKASIKKTAIDNIKNKKSNTDKSGKTVQFQNVKSDNSTDDIDCTEDTDSNDISIDSIESSDIKKDDLDRVDDTIDSDACTIDLD